MDRFDSMRAFVAVCDAQGFAAAGRRLNLSPSAVTRLVAALEDHLGVRLLQRTTRTLRLTDPGARFLERARRILADIAEAEDSALDETARPRGLLTVAAPLLFGRIHVAPIVDGFLNAFSETQVELTLSDRNAPLVEDGVDVAIRIGALADSALVARRLGQTRRVVVASPDYLRRYGTPATPLDLADHRVVAFTALGSGRAWRFPSPDGGEIEVALVPRLSVNAGDAAINHALAGGGVTAALCYQVADALRSGALVEILHDYAPPPVPISAVFPTRRLLSANVRAFLDLAQDAARGWTFGA